MREGMSFLKKLTVMYIQKSLKREKKFFKETYNGVYSKGPNS